MSAQLKRFTISGLHNRKNIDIDFKSNLAIFMGPNGIGKSTILNIFVHFLGCQWNRLAKQPFDNATIEFVSGEIATVNKIDCNEFLFSDLSPRTQNLATMLAEEDMLEVLIDGRALTDDFSSKLSKSQEFSLRDLRIVRTSLMQYPQAVASLSSLSNASKIIRRNFFQKILYLPTYRRIEQDLSEVFSINSSALRRFQAEFSEAAAQPSSTYIELVRFGMDDIKKLIEDYTSEIKEYSRQQINSLSTKYLTAALRQRQTFDRSFFNNLSDDRIKDILGRVDDAELNASQRKGITDLIRSLRTRQGGGRLSRAQEHIASYFQMLAETHDRISKREVPLQALAATLNRYIGPTKFAFYDQTRYQFVIRGGSADIPLSGLSSGEKQIMSLFATLVLAQNTQFYVVIDEPELSLSVLWQEILISDIMELPSCDDLLAVTHSPFIYGERFASYTRDLSDHAQEMDRRSGADS